MCILQTNVHNDISQKMSIEVELVKCVGNMLLDVQMFVLNVECFCEKAKLKGPRQSLMKYSGCNK